ncbi:MAG: hypothetical protein RL630_760 [Verrucomicrobiota bacterium]|jgi:hypothetical protein
MRSAEVHGLPYARGRDSGMGRTWLSEKTGTGFPCLHQLGGLGGSDSENRAGTHPTCRSEHCWRGRFTRLRIEVSCAPGEHRMVPGGLGETRSDRSNRVGSDDLAGRSRIQREMPHGLANSSAAERRMSVMLWTGNHRLETKSGVGNNPQEGSSRRRLSWGRAMTWAAMTLPSVPTACSPASSAAFTAATSPRMMIVT